jgi:sugar phosphate isomerase/epimerase
MDKLDIHPRVCLNPICSMNWTLEQDIAFCKEAGVEAIAIPHFKFRDREAEGIALIKQAGLRGVGMSTGGGSLIDSGAHTLEALRGAIDTASALGCPSFYGVVGAAGARMTTDEAFARLVDCIGPANAYARDKGVRLAFEQNSIATRGHGFIHTLADLADLAREADVGICLELQNCWYERNLERLFNDNISRIVFVQVSDFKVGEEIKYNRRVPGDGDMPLEWMLGALLNAGYRGYFDVEILGPAVEAEGYPLAIRRSLNWLSERLTAWGV